MGGLHLEGFVLLLEPVDEDRLCERDLQIQVRHQTRGGDAGGHVGMIQRLLEPRLRIDPHVGERVERGQANVRIDVGQEGDDVRLRELGAGAHLLQRLQGGGADLEVLVLGGETEADHDRLVLHLHAAEQGRDLPFDIDMLGAEQINERGDRRPADLVQRPDRQPAHAQVILRRSGDERRDRRRPDGRQRVGSGVGGAAGGLEQERLELRNRRRRRGTHVAERLDRVIAQLHLVGAEHLDERRHRDFAHRRQRRARRLANVRIRIAERIDEDADDLLRIGIDASQRIRRLASHVGTRVRHRLDDGGRRALRLRPDEREPPHRIKANRGALVRLKRLGERPHRRLPDLRHRHGRVQLHVLALTGQQLDQRRHRVRRLVAERFEFLDRFQLLGIAFLQLGDQLGNGPLPRLRARCEQAEDEQSRQQKSSAHIEDPSFVSMLGETRERNGNPVLRIS